MLAFLLLLLLLRLPATQCYRPRVPQQRAAAATAAAGCGQTGMAPAQRG
jgi:hypothetical protein